ncbi:peptidase family M1 [Xylariaceae sp. FL0804]|nr:peptidase family M1 [Xylariaceae sp. FL0804]
MRGKLRWPVSGATPGVFSSRPASSSWQSTTIRVQQLQTPSGFPKRLLSDQLPRHSSAFSTLCPSPPAISVWFSSYQKQKRPSRFPHPSRLQLASSLPSSSLATRLSTCRFFSASSRASCCALIPSSIMADRDILPATVVPSHYDLSISDIKFDDWSYQGEVNIDVKIQEPTKEIILNALQLRLHKAEVTLQQSKTSAVFSTAAFDYDDKKQRVTLRFTDAIPPSQKAALKISFQGIINNDTAGFYRSKYKPAVPAKSSVPRDDVFHYMFSTQFESCDARRAFPCFDEPRLKATFDFQIEIPADLKALSNMPETIVNSPRGDAFKIWKFDRTPVMSTYLLAWAFGDFECVETTTGGIYNGKQIPVRVWATNGLQEQGKFALKYAPAIIDLFSEKFGIAYPLPKADLLAVHEFTHGAMENWGLITYRTTALLFDEKTSDLAYKNRVAYVVAHELAHQWFGNLVTMDWWDELWLNESFATWAGWYAVDHFEPKWHVWAQFVSEGMENAFKLDGMRASHPVHVPVKDALDVNQIFDHISYLKGCSTLRMLINHLHVDTFLKGVGAYLRKHAYGNAKTENLWQALSEASGQDVNALMSNWIEKIGHPLVTIAEEPGQISLKQNRYLSTGDVKPNEDETVWWVPLAFSGKAGKVEVQSLTLTERETTIRGVDDDYYVVNKDATGFYRTNYPPARLIKLSSQLQLLQPEDKISIIGSAADLAFSGYGTTPSLLSFLEGFGEERSYLVWSQVLGALGLVKTIFSDDETIREGLKKFSLKLIGNAVDRIGWEYPAQEDYLTTLLRKRLLLSAVNNDHPAAMEKALSLFDAWVSKGTPINPNLRTVAYRAAIKAKPAVAVDALMKEWYNGTSIDGTVTCLTALGQTRDVGLIENTLFPFLFNLSPPAPPAQSVPASDMHSLGSSLATNSTARPLQWKFMQEHWDQLTAKMANPVVLDRFVKISLNKFTDAAYVDEIEAFFRGRDTSAFDRTLEQVKDAIRGRAAYRQRDADKIREWLAANGYAA